MIELFCILDPFSYIQKIKVKVNGKDDNDIMSQMERLVETLIIASKWQSKSKIYLSGLPEENLLPIKEEILSQIEYSNNNIEVEII